jgi:hypothetical protein
MDQVTLKGSFRDIF